MNTFLRGALLCGVLSTGCIVEAPGADGRTPTGSRASSAATAPLLAQSGAIFGGKIELASAQFRPGVLQGGEPIQVTFTFNVLEDVTEDYVVFVHLEDPSGGMERVNFDHRPQAGKSPTSSWKKGMKVEDTFQIYVPPGGPTRAVVLLAGLWHPDRDERLKLTNPDKVRSDGAGRVLLAQLAVR
jgi:hypothetical protein